MKVLIITGSPHKHGTSAHLVEQFKKGAMEAGNDIFVFESAFKKVHPCIACDKCIAERRCTFKDDMDILNPKLLEADIVVFAYPIYYYNINAQLKTVIDRFYATNSKLMQTHKKVYIISAMEDDTMESADGANVAFKGMCKYLGWDLTYCLNAMNVLTAEDLKNTTYLDDAYNLGKSIK